MIKFLSSFTISLQNELKICSEITKLSTKHTDVETPSLIVANSQYYQSYTFTPRCLLAILLQSDPAYSEAPCTHLLYNVDTMQK